MTSKMLSTAYLLIGLLVATECRSADSDEQGRQIVSMAKAASGGTAWDRLEIMHDEGELIPENGDVLLYERWIDLRTLSLRAGTGPKGDTIFDGRVAYDCHTTT